jgi:cyclophilin family peptidyl-prolyl cis-trans isomerase/HEAT repeat protein
MQTGNFRKALGTAFLIVVPIMLAAGQELSPANGFHAIPDNILRRILRAEDERRWDQNLTALLADQSPNIRQRAGLALGRIGDERAVPPLVVVLQKDTNGDVRQMIAFALGEIESPDGADALISVVNNARESGAVRARAVEGLGKIGAVLLGAATDQTSAPQTKDTRLTKIRSAILEALKFEASRRSPPDRATILLGLTAALRVRPEGSGPVIIRFLEYSDPRIVADALNTMARLRLKDANDHVRRLLAHSDPIVRANAARVIGAAEDQGAFDALLERALNDSDLRVRVSAIRALGNLKDARAATALVTRGKSLLLDVRQKQKLLAVPAEVNELLEIVTSVGRILTNSNDKEILRWLREIRATLELAAPEVEIAFARISPQTYEIDADQSLRKPLLSDPGRALEAQPVPAARVWRRWANVSQGLAELAATKSGNAILDSSIKETTVGLLQFFLKCRPYAQSERRYKPRAGDVVTVRCVPLEAMAVPDFLRAYAAFKPSDLGELLMIRLNERDVISRATAAELLADLPPSAAITQALSSALPVALRDQDLNDAALSILDALAKQKSTAANDAIKTALDSDDHLIRRRAVALLKTNGVGDFSNRIGTVKTRNTEADYRRAIARIGRKVTATVVTSKGAFTIEFFPAEAPLTVDNFVQLARRSYFNGQTVPRVVPNFVIQTGDPRGDQNGGPGYQIRCEINEVPYDRGAVGMALSGKDTGGSQWFVTHSPQPHLDGGYTVFGRVISGMNVVDNIARGDTIRRVIVNER